MVIHTLSVVLLNLASSCDRRDAPVSCVEGLGELFFSSGAWSISEGGILLGVVVAHRSEALHLPPMLLAQAFPKLGPNPETREVWGCPALGLPRRRVPLCRRVLFWVHAGMWVPERPS